MMELERPITSLEIVAPFFNEQDGCVFFYQALMETLEPLGISYSMVFVDDGSKDNTYKILKEIASKDNRVRVMGLVRNFGHQPALTAGLDVADAQVIITMDSDMQHPPSLIPVMLNQYQAGSDVVYAVRKNDHSVGLVKRWTSSAYYRMLDRISNTSMVQGAADFRLMAKPVVDSLSSMRERHRYLRGMVSWLGYSYAVIPYEQPERYSGKPGYSFRKSFNLAKNGLFSFSTIPLSVITVLGFIVTLGAFLYLLYILAAAFRGETVEGWASNITVALILGGIQLISLGVIAQYIGMIFEQVKERPLYILREEDVPENDPQKNQKNR
ncbi:MAG: glycosyltransferase family 2 protein [Anaerolineales bacterium]|nr:glycosyltransferase family 2 protein [Anaerolineales bacterium]